MQYLKFLNIFNFFNKKQDPSYEQDSKLIKYANSLIEDEKMQPLKDMVDKGYLLTPGQTDSLASFLGATMFAKRGVFHKNHSETMLAALLIYQKFPKHSSFYSSFEPHGDRLDSIFFHMRFDLKFFYRYGRNCLQKLPENRIKEDWINYEIKPDQKLIITAINVISDVLKYFLDNDKNNNKQKKIDLIISVIPLEIHPFLYEKDNRLKDYLTGSTNTSIYKTLEENTFDRECNKGKKFSQLDKDDQDDLIEKEVFFKSAKNFLPKISSLVKDTKTLHENMLETLISSQRTNINEANFISSDIAKLYELDDINSKKISLIQAMYGKLIISNNLNIENKNFIENIPNNVIKILKFNEESRELLAKDEALKPLDDILASLMQINLEIEQNKMNELLHDNSKQMRMNK